MAATPINQLIGAPGNPDQLLIQPTESFPQPDEFISVCRLIRIRHFGRDTGPVIQSTQVLSADRGQIDPRQFLGVRDPQTIVRFHE
jgi:hypothetical protein